MYFDVVCDECKKNRENCVLLIFGGEKKNPTSSNTAIMVDYKNILEKKPESHVLYNFLKKIVLVLEVL